MENLILVYRNIVSCLNSNQGGLSFLFSLLAIILSIAVPAKIANNQNKITLIQHRYELYDVLSFLKRLATDGDQLGFENKSRWDKNHRAKRYFLLWLHSIGTISINHPQLNVNFQAIRENGILHGWEMHSMNGYSLDDVKTAFLHACSSQNSILEERKLLFNNKNRELIEQIQQTYLIFYTEIAITADFSEDTQDNYEAETFEGAFDRIDSIAGGLEASRRAFQEAVERADDKGLYKTARKLSTF